MPPPADTVSSDLTARVEELQQGRVVSVEALEHGTAALHERLDQIQGQIQEGQATLEDKLADALGAFQARLNEELNARDHEVATDVYGLILIERVIALEKRTGILSPEDEKTRVRHRGRHRSHCPPKATGSSATTPTRTQFNCLQLEMQAGRPRRL